MNFKQSIVVPHTLYQGEELIELPAGSTYKIQVRPSGSGSYHTVDYSVPSGKVCKLICKLFMEESNE